MELPVLGGDFVGGAGVSHAYGTFQKVHGRYYDIVLDIGWEIGKRLGFWRLALDVIRRGLPFGPCRGHVLQGSYKFIS